MYVISIRKRYSSWALRWLHMHSDAWEIGAMDRLHHTCTSDPNSNAQMYIQTWCISLDLQLLFQKGTSLPAVLFQVSCVNAPGLLLTPQLQRALVLISWPVILVSISWKIVHERWTRGFRICYQLPSPIQ